MKSLTEEWEKFLKAIPPRADPLHPTAFNNAIDKIVVEAAKLARKADIDGLADPEILAELKRRNLDNLSNAARVRTDYANAFSTMKDLSNARKQYDWAHFWENFRLLVFRVLSAMGIAAVVLGTYYIGWKAGIPMPLRLPV